MADDWKTLDEVRFVAADNGLYLVHEDREKFLDALESLRTRLTEAIDDYAKARTAQFDANIRAERAEDFISRNRGISGMIADYDQTRPTDEWEPFVRDILNRVVELEKENVQLTNFLQMALKNMNSKQEGWSPL